MSAIGERARPARQHVNYHEDTTSEDEQDGEADYRPEPASKSASKPVHDAPARTSGRRTATGTQSTTKRRSTRQAVDARRPTYQDLSSDDSELEAENDLVPESRRPAKRRKIATPQKRQSRTAAPRIEFAQSKPRQAKRERKSKRAEKREGKKRVLAKPLKPRTKAKSTRYTGPSDNVTPNWTSLPLNVLRDIFDYASQPRQEQVVASSQNATWLIRAARTCRAFTIPALEAYYQSFYPLTEVQPHDLLNLLQKPRDGTLLDYRVKLRNMAIDVRRIAYLAHGRDRFDISALVRLTPQLQHFEIYNPFDKPPFRSAVILQKWKYPEDLFHALDEGGAKLKTWRWSRDMVPDTGSTDTYTYMSLAHKSSAFQSLERLVVCRFDVNDNSVAHLENQDESTRIPRLAAVISQLPTLKDLTFISCDLIMEDFLDHLPRNLKRLELTNCLELTSGMLIKFFETGGSQLKELVLNHNSAVDLMFLPELKTHCPQLETLKMDLTYYSERITYNDAWAMYDHLLTANDIPTWPSTLRHLELINLQKWSAEAAQNLFRSLVHGASELLNLRHLVIQAHINIPWRDRAGFRDQWIERLNTVYLRRSKDPSPYMGSLKQMRLYKQAIADGRVIASPADLEGDDEFETRRRLLHVRVTPRKSDPEVETINEVEAGPSIPPPATSSRRSVRVRQRAESQTISTTGDDSDAIDNDSDHSGDDSEAYIQGFCDVVDIRIDNQRPRETQYTEANFLDSEASGDEDWHSGAELEDDGYAW